MTSLELCIPFNYRKFTVFKVWLNFKKQLSYMDLFTAIEYICWLFWAFSDTEMTDFPTLSYTWSLEKVPRLGGVFHYRGHYNNSTFDILLVMFIVLFTYYWYASKFTKYAGERSQNPRDQCHQTKLLRVFLFFNIRMFGAFGNEEREDQRLSNHGFFKLSWESTFKSSWK